MLSTGSTRVAGRRAMERCAGCGSLASTQKRWASNGNKEKEAPFYMQLQESIQDRVQKEKAEQLAIQSLQQRTARGKFWATITGMSSRTSTPECYAMLYCTMLYCYGLF